MRGRQLSPAAPPPQAPGGRGRHHCRFRPKRHTQGSTSLSAQWISKTRRVDVVAFPLAEGGATTTPSKKHIAGWKGSSQFGETESSPQSVVARGDGGGERRHASLGPICMGLSLSLSLSLF